MYDLEVDSETDSTYECLICGEIIATDSRPQECPQCGSTGTFRNRALSPE